MYSLPSLDKIQSEASLYIDLNKNYHRFSSNTHTFTNIYRKHIQLYKLWMIRAKEKAIHNAQLEYTEVVFEK